MTIKADETKNFNRMVRDLNTLNRFLLSTYSGAQKEVEALIAVYRQTQSVSPLTPGSLLQLKRLNDLNTQITIIINQTIAQERAGIATGYRNQWNDTYLNTAFNTEGAINTGALGAANDFDVDLNYHNLNTDFIKATFNAPIGGQTFTTRTATDRAILQSQVKSATAQAIIEGLSSKELADRLESVDNAFTRGSNKALLTAQQELTTAYSHGQRDAIDTAIDNGVEGKNEWVATLDGKTRKDHAKEDGKIRNEITGLFTFSDGTTITMPRIRGAGTAGLNQIMRCRCRMLFLPFGIRSTVRAAKMEDGSWEEVNGDLTWEEWSKTIEGKRTIEAEVAYRKARNKRLAKKRAAGSGDITGESSSDAISRILKRRGATTAQQINDIDATLDRMGQDAWVDSLTKDELDSLTFYTGVGDNPINTLLRENELSGLAELRGMTTEEINEHITNIGGGIDKLTLTEDIVVWRNPGLDIIDQYIDADIGDILVDQGFSSTSMRSDIFGFSEDINDEGKYKLEILMRQGGNNGPLSSISQNPGEYEILLNNGASLQKIGNRVDETTGITFLQFEVI